MFQFIEKYFWIFMLAGIAAGLFFPVYNNFFMSLLQPFVMAMLFLVFLKIDLIKILRSLRQYKLMAYLVIMLLFVVPIAIYYFTKIFDEKIALGLLLLCAMPAGTSSPALADLIKGNAVLSMSITILTSLIAPFSIPFIFIMIAGQNLEINPWSMFQTLALLVFVPMILSQIIKRLIPTTINKIKSKFSAINVLIIFFIIYTAIGSKHEFIINNPISVIKDLAILYLVFIVLHIIGYLIAFKQGKADKIAIIISKAYMNNSLALVLAASFFSPSILVLMVLSQIPWNTLLAPFQKTMKYVK